MEIVLAIIVIVLLYYLFKYVLIPLATNVVFPLLVGAFGIGVAFALVMSVIYFVRAIKNNANPYLTYVDKHKNANGRRNYFFGPGYHSIGQIIKETFSGISGLVLNVKEKIWDFKLLHTVFLWIWPVVFFVGFAICTYVFGFAFCTVLSVLLISVIFVMMVYFFLAFSILWGADRLYLIVKSINCRCPVDKKRFIVPAFKCPHCNSVYKASLTPGAYGVLHTRCQSCNKKLPTTVFNGRSDLAAVCPACGTDLASGTSSQFGIQCVGNTQSGKTAYLAAFFHELFENDGHKNISYTRSPERLFINLEAMFNNGKTLQTTDNNAAMYSVVYKGAGLSDFQFSVYDIAGEAFNDILKENQKQFDYTEGFFYIVSPDEDANDNLNLYSRFVEYLRSALKINTRKKIDIPLAVLITKADRYKRDIGPLSIAIRASTNKSAEIEGASFEEKLTFTREKACKDFLESIGLNNLVNLINRDFVTYSFFSVSAMGHEESENLPFEPMGTLEPVKWIIKQSGNSLSKKIFDKIQ